MKPHRFKFILLASFYAFIVVNTIFAQEPYGKITGNVADSRGQVSRAQVTVKLKNSNSSPQTVTTDDDGNFTFSYIRLGTYDVKVESSCMSLKVENVQLSYEKPLNLNLKLVYEDCEKKTAEEAAEWATCEQETAIPGLEAIGFDKAAAVNQILEDSLNYENGSYTYRGELINISTENIKSEWLKPFPNLKINLLNPQEIKVQAEKAKDGIFGYLRFAQWRLSSSCAFAGLSEDIAVSKTSTIGLCGNQSSIIYLYRKKGDKWKKVSKQGYF